MRSHLTVTLARGVLLAAVLVAVPAARGQQPAGALPFVGYGADKGFGPWGVRAISQDARGLLWVGTDDGIYLYDGHRFQRAPMDGLTSSHVDALRAGRGGDMWCRTQEGWARWHGGRWRRYDGEPLALTREADLQLDGHGRAWVASRHGLLREAQARVVRLEKQATEQQMAGGFAHEMRNTLTGAKMLLGTVLGEGEPDARRPGVINSGLLKELYLEIREHLPPEARPRVVTLLKTLNGNEARLDGVLGGVDEALGRGLSFTHMVLEYARLGRERPGGEQVQVRAVLDSILAECRESFATHAITVHVEVAPGCTVEGSPLHLRSILQNLVLNARDTLREKSGPGARELRIRAGSEPGRTVLRVEDTGEGMADEVRERIFEPFFSTKPDTGTGLGLNVVRKLVDLYGGTLAVESTPGQGTCFTVVLPGPRGP